MKGFKSTRQVTKAMELVSASKMRRAVQNAQMLRRYALTAWSVLQKVAAVHSGQHALLTVRPVHRILAVVFTSDRGLCGSFNSNILKALTQYVRGMQNLGPDIEVDFVAVGRKGQVAASRLGGKLLAAFPALSNHPAFRDALPISKLAIDSFMDGTYDRVVLVYSDFISALVQEPTVKPLLPFSETELKSMIESMFPDRRTTKEEEAAMRSLPPVTEYMFEPSAGEVLDRILPRLTELQIYQAALETAASEHSARMVAMRNASDNAADIIDDLTLTYNQSRQSIITAELAELSASKAALD